MFYFINHYANITDQPYKQETIYETSNINNKEETQVINNKQNKDNPSDVFTGHDDIPERQTQNKYTNEHINDEINKMFPNNYLDRILSNDTTIIP